MKRTFPCSLLAVVALSLFVGQSFAQLSGVRPAGIRGATLNFKNVTTTNVVETVTEIPDNEKSIEFGDYDNDGDLDVSVAVALSDFIERRNKLYRNDNGVLTEVTNAAIPGYLTLEVTRNTFFRDYDNDGWLDIISVSDSNNGPGGLTKYYRNNHPGGVFSNFVDESSRLNNAEGAACAAISVDVDHDGDADLYLGNYPFDSQDTMYLNDGTGNFTNVTFNQVPSESDYTTDVAHADMNGDGKVDLLVASSFGDADFIYYNDLNGAGSGLGDFKYAGSQWQVPNSFNNGETAMEPGDFNGDGLMDIYYSNRNSGDDDMIFLNQGNDASGKATFQEITMPGPVSQSRTHKCTVADLNKDGRPDLIVMSQTRRPYIFRNTSINGNLSFVNWTPASAFPSSTIHAGWHAGVADVDGDKKLDIMVGGRNHDHLFLNSKSTEIKEKGLSGAVLPAIHNSDPVAVIGTATAGTRDIFTCNGLPANADISVVLRSSGDVMLEVKNSGGAVIASSDRGAIGIEEVAEFTASGTITFEVVMMAGASDPPYVLEILARD